MRRAARQRLLLLIVVAALSTLAAWQWRRDARAMPPTLLGIDPASVTQIALTFSGQPAQHYRKRDGHWWRIDGTGTGTPVRADDGRIGELADTAAAPAFGWRPAGDFDPARIGLAPPVATLVLDGHMLEFGGTSATGPLCYVRVGADVALVSIAQIPRAEHAESVKMH